MGKTFEEWFTEKTVWGSVEDELHLSYGWDRDSLDFHRTKELLKEAWDASRYDMTYRDI